jgi:hypothetical protein
VDDEHGGDIGQQHQGQPLEQVDVALVRDEHLQQHRQHAEADRVQLRRAGATSFIASPIAATSAAMLIVFATSSRPTMGTAAGAANSAAGWWPGRGR